MFSVSRAKIAQDQKVTLGVERYVALSEKSSIPPCPIGHESPKTYLDINTNSNLSSVGIIAR